MRVYSDNQAHILHNKPMHRFALQFLEGNNLAFLYAGSHIRTGAASSRKIYGAVFYAGAAYLRAARAFANHSRKAILSGPEHKRPYARWS